MKPWSIYQRGDTYRLGRKVWFGCVRWHIANAGFFSGPWQTTNLEMAIEERNYLNEQQELAEKYAKDEWKEI